MFRFFTRLKLKAKIIVSMVSLMILAFAVVVPMVAGKAENQAKDDAFKITEEMNHRYGNRVKNEIERILFLLRGLSYTFSRSSDIPADSRRTLFTALLKKAIDENKEILSFWTMWEGNALDNQDEKYKGSKTATETGKFTATWRRDKEQIILGNDTDEGMASGEYYQIPKKTLNETILDPYFYSYTGKKEDEILMSSIAVPIIQNGKFVGVVGVDIAMEQFQSMILDIKPYETGYALLVGANGTRVAHPKKEQIGKILGDDIPEKQSWILESVKKGVQFSLFKKSARDGKESYLMFTPIPIGKTGQNWSFGIVISMDKVLESGVALSNEIIRSSLLIVLVILSIVITLMVLLANSMSKPIIQHSGNLAVSANGVKSAASQISSSSQQLASGASELASSVEEMTSSLEELQSIIESSTKNVNEAEKMMQNTMESSRNVTGQMTSMQTAMKEISDQSKKIGKIIKVIDDIAFQTNILALNAAVEAARAGEAGRGFVVVAEQVKNLAGKSAEAAKETADLIEKAITSVESGQRQGNQVMEMQLKAGELAEKVNTLLSEVNSASKEQIKGANQINKAVLQINNVVQATASSSEELAAAGEQLLSQAENTSVIVKELNLLVKKESQISSDATKEKPKKGTHQKISANQKYSQKTVEKQKDSLPEKKVVNKKEVEIVKPEDQIPFDDFEGF